MPSDYHPYECDGPGRCIHCDADVTPTHEPWNCALCCDGDPPGNEADYWVGVSLGKYYTRGVSHA